MAIQLLDVWDYVIITALLTVSALFGLYHGLCKVKQSTFIEYTLASRQVSTFPIALSSFATLVGSGMLIGSPAETYMYGSQATFIALAAFIIAPFIGHFIIPIYRNLSCTSLFQFFELRYSVGFKNLITISFFITGIAVSSVTMYGPATVLSIVTGVNVWAIVLIMDGLCLVYTILGGMRAVIFADVIQGAFMLLTIVSLVVLGCFHVGGVAEIWKRNINGNRIEFFNFSLDPTIRHTVWTSVIGWAIITIAFSTSNQAIIQRYLATETLEQAQNANLIACILSAVGQLFSFLAGLVAFAIFYKCDPLASGAISNVNQLLPLIVMETFGQYSGFPGLYFTGLLSASLSTVSSLINSLASVTIESFLRPYCPNIAQNSYTKYCKYLALFYGLLSLLGVLLVQLFPNVLQATASISGSITGPTLGTMLVGMIFPQTNRKASMVAFGVGVGICLWSMVGSLVGHFEEPPRAFSTDGCNQTAELIATNASHLIFHITPNVTSANFMAETLPPARNFIKTAFPLSTISYMWLATLGFATSGFLTILATFVLEAEKRETCCPQFVPPVLQRLHKRLNVRWRRRLYCDIYATEETNCARNGGDHPEFISPLLQ